MGDEDDKGGKLKNYNVFPDVQYTLYRLRGPPSVDIYLCARVEYSKY